MTKEKKGKGLTVSVQGDEVLISFNRKANFGPSKSGDNNIVAGSGGWIDVGEGVRFNLNAITAK